MITGVVSFGETQIKINCSVENKYIIEQLLYKSKAFALKKFLK